jgi:hypothetical protein
MFRPADRISLKEVWDALATDVVKRFRRDGQADDYQSMSEATAWACWDFCAKAGTARVVMPSGKLESLAPSILRTHDDDLTYNEHIDLQIGTIGSGKGGDQREHTVRMLYGPALYCPVVFTDAEFVKFMRVFASLPKLESNSDSAVVRRIVDCYREDPSRNSKEIQRLAAGRVSGRAYKRCRGLAAQIEPGLINGGRKPSKKP